HRQIPARGPQSPAGLQPAEARHHHVEEQQIQRVTAGPTGPTELVEHGETVGDGAGVVPLDLEHPLQRVTDGRVIIRDQYPHAGPPPFQSQSRFLPLSVPGQPEARLRASQSVAGDGALTDSRETASGRSGRPGRGRNPRTTRNPRNPRNPPTTRQAGTAETSGTAGAAETAEASGTARQRTARRAHAADPRCRPRSGCARRAPARPVPRTRRRARAAYPPPHPYAGSARTAAAADRPGTAAAPGPGAE